MGDSLPQGRKVGSFELRTAWMEGRQEQGLRGNMVKKLLTAPHPPPSCSHTPPSRPELLPDSLASPSPNTLWTRKRRHTSIARIETPPFMARVSQSRSPGFAPSSPSRYSWSGRGLRAGFLASSPQPPALLGLAPSELRGSNRGRHAQCPHLPGHLTPRVQAHSLCSLGKGSSSIQPPGLE